MSHPGRTHRRALARILAAGAGAAVSFFSTAAIGAPAVTPAPSAPLRIAPDSAFLGTLFPQPVVHGTIDLKAQRAWVWREGATRRVMLAGDVRVRLATYEFIAQRASVWMERVSEPGQPEVQQVFVVFDELGDPAAPAGAGFQARQLPVRAVIQLSSPVRLESDSVVSTQPDPRTSGDIVAFSSAADALLAAAIARHQGQDPTPRVATGVPFVRPGSAPSRQPGHTPAGTAPPQEPSGPASRAVAAGRDEAAAQEQATRTLARAPGEPIFARDGIVSFGAGDITVTSGEHENTIVASNGVTVQYQDLRTGRFLQLTAERGVIFTQPGPLASMQQFSAEQVLGVYLEGDVTATDGTYTMRGPQVYYDFQNNRALMLDAVFWTYDERRQLPLYVRAGAVRQTAADQFRADRAVFTNSAFFEPELAIGASSVTITRRQEEVAPASPLDSKAPRQTVSTTFVEATDITARAGGVPFFYWPRYSGDPSMQPIRDLRIENRSGSGGAIRATINAYSLLGLKTPSDTRLDVLADYYFERGPALGVRSQWANENSRGGIFGYMVPFDFGKDVLKSGEKRDRDHEFRGILLGEQRWKVDEAWSIFAEGAYISDSTFIDAFYEEAGETRREFTNRLRADRVESNTALSLEVKGTFNDFISNEYLLQSQGYSVTKLPELVYVRQADDLLAQTRPGLLSYWSEYRVGRLELALDETTPRERGFSSEFLSRRAMGIDPDQRLSDVLRSRGYFEEPIYRADTRHELSLNMNAGPVKITPFVVGRATAYDNEFSAFSPDNDDNFRLWAAAGVRVSTTVQRVYDNVDSSLFDIHRLRHIIEPNMTVWHAGTTVDSEALPVYDDQVEALNEGSVVRVGVTQILQTQRGAPGRWHTSDLLTLSTDLVFSSGEGYRRGPIGRFYDYRPEYANAGNYFVGDVVYRLTDATALTGGMVYDLDDSQQAMSIGGVSVRHSAQFSTSADIRYINELDSTLINAAALYELTSKYTVFAGASYDLDGGGFQSTGVEVRRKFSSLEMGVSIEYNDITGETSLGFVLRPFGLGSGTRINNAGSPDSLGI